MSQKKVLIGAVIAGIAYFFLKRKKRTAVAMPSPIILPGYEPGSAAVVQPTAQGYIQGLGFLSSSDDVLAVPYSKDVDSGATAF